LLISLIYKEFTPSDRKRKNIRKFAKKPPFRVQSGAFKGEKGGILGHKRAFTAKNTVFYPQSTKAAAGIENIPHPNTTGQAKITADGGGFAVHRNRLRKPPFAVLKSFLKFFLHSREKCAIISQRIKKEV